MVSVVLEKLRRWGVGEGLSQAPQMQDLVNVRPHPVVSPRNSAGAGAGAPGLGRQLHSQNVAPFVTRKRLPDRAFPGAVLPPRGRWMWCAGFPWAFGLSSTAAAQGNQAMISEPRAVTLVPASLGQQLLRPLQRQFAERGLMGELRRFWEGYPGTPQLGLWPVCFPHCI